MAIKDLKYSDLTQKIIGCSMKVHRYFGTGFPEVVYKRALIIELRKIGISCQEEVEREIIYEGRVIHKRRLDLLVEEVVLVELKALKEVDNSETNQILNYLRVFKIEVGLLLNFGVPSLFFKRYIHTITN
jgi:GxxExxY protein